MFEQWATSDPQRLLDVLTSPDTRPTLLTYAAEIAGKNLESADVVPKLLALLEHADCVVREGAIYGLTSHAGEAIDAALERLAVSDPSPGVREAASDVIDTRRNGPLIDVAMLTVSNSVLKGWS
jgi:HEAT repeat protein